MRKLTSCLVILLVLCSVSLAESYTYIDSNPINNYTLGSFADEARFSFDTNTSILEFEIRFDKSVLRPDGFQFVVSHGPAPSTSGEQAVIFFDADTPGQPRLTAYAYNSLGMYDGVKMKDHCGNAPGSYAVGMAPNLAADPIESINDTSWVLSTTDQETLTHRVLGGRLDLSTIINHTPAYPGAFPWNGFGFENTIGVWLWAAPLISSPAYDANGYLVTWPTPSPTDFQTCIFYDFGDRATNKGPLCTGADIDVQTNVGTPVSFTISASDDNGDDLSVSYTGTPTTAVVTPAAGTYPSPIDVDFAWTPDLNDGGTSTTFVATFSDGVNPSIECPATIRVPQNEAPTCQITGAQQDLVCTGNQTRIELDGLKSLDPEGADLTYAWSIECNGPASLEDTSGPTTALVFTDANASNDVECSISLVVSDGLQSSSCKATANISACPSCTDTSVADKLALLDGNTFTMSKLVKNLASELKRVTGKAAPKSVKDQVKQAKALHIEAWESINQVPSVIQSCVNANACVAVSHASAISVYKDDSADLLTLIKSVAKKVKAALKTNTTIGNRKRWQRIEKKGIRLNAQNIAEASALPEVNTVCP